MVDYSKWNDKDLDALLNDGDDDSNTPAATKSDKKDDREAERHEDKLAESIAAVRIRTAPEAVHETLAELRSELESLPLSGLFARALKMFTQIHGAADSEGCGARGEEREALIARALTVVQRAQDVAERAGLFSDNEALEDVKTGDLKYLLLPFFAAELLGEEMNMDRRPAALTLAENAYLQFLERCVGVGAAAESFMPACRRLVAGGGGGGSSSSSMEDAAAQRAERIARHRREKEVDEQLKPAPLVALLVQCAREGAHGAEEDTKDIADEAAVRARIVLEIEHALLKTLNEVPMMQQEMQMLNMRAKMAAARPVSGGANSLSRGANSFTSKRLQDEGGGRGKGITSVHIPKNNGLGAASGSQPAQLGQGRVMIDPNSATKRQDMLSGVFRDFNPSTMTVEEWGHVEYARMQEQQALQMQKNMEKAAEESKLTEEDKEERERLKASNWDDYKDENPRGAGNRKDNYFKR